MIPALGEEQVSGLSAKIGLDHLCTQAGDMLNQHPHVALQTLHVRMQVIQARSRCIRLWQRRAKSWDLQLSNCFAFLDQRGHNAASRLLYHRDKRSRKARHKL